MIRTDAEQIDEVNAELVARTLHRERIAGTLRDDAAAMRELGIDPSVLENMEEAADLLAPNSN